MSKSFYSNNSIVCIDISGSVSGYEFYWKTVKSIVNDWLIRFPNPVWCFWNTDAIVSYTKDLYIKHFSEKIGYNATMSDVIVPVLKNHKINENILLITDGEVDNQSIDRCDLQLRQYHVNNVECHIINSSPNLSVTCPFTRKNTSKVYTYKPSAKGLSQLVFNYSINDYKILEGIESLSYDTFMEKYEKIYELLVQVNMGSNGNSGYKNSLISLKNRLVKEHSKRLSEGNDYEASFRVEADSKNWNMCIEISTEITKKFYSTSQINDNIITRLDKLINMCNGSMRYNFDPNSVKSQAFNRAELTSKFQPQPVEEQNSVFECPISYDNDSCCILVNFNKDFWSKLDKSTTDFIKECPLRALDNKDIINTIKSCILHSIGLRTIPELNNQNPFTREKFDGVISLANDSEHIKANNWVLANILTRGKTFGNFDCWMFVIYKVASTIEYLSNIMPLFKEHLIWRYRQTKSYASLNGLGLLPTTELPFDLCCLYILYSTYYVVEPRFDTVRFHMPHIEYLQEIVNMCFKEECITVDIKLYILKLKFLNAAMSFCKRSNNHYIFLKNIQKAIYQNFMIDIDNFNCVLIDGKVEDQEYMFNNLQSVFNTVDFNTLRLLTKNDDLIREWLYNILEEVSPSKNIGDILVNPILENKATNVENWEFTDYNKYLESLKTNKIEISYNTFRPLTYVKNPNNPNEIITWRESLYLIHGTLSGDTFSGYRYFLDYFIDKLKVPSEKEYIVYCFNRISRSKKFSQATVPKSIFAVYKEVMKDYKEVFMKAKKEGISSNEIKRRILDSLELKKREKIEKI